MAAGSSSSSSRQLYSSPLSFSQLRFILAGFLCLWLLGILHTWKQLFQYHEEEDLLFLQSTNQLGNRPPEFQPRPIFQTEFQQPRPRQPRPHHPMVANNNNQRQHGHRQSPRHMMIIPNNRKNNNNNNNNNIITADDSTIIRQFPNGTVMRQYPNGTFEDLKDNSNSMMMQIMKQRQKRKRNKMNGPRNKTKGGGGGRFGWMKQAIFGKESPPLDLPKPVIVMGFPKAGTSSIFSFFQNQGLKAQHWYCCKPQSDPQQGGPALMAGCMMNNLRKKHFEKERQKQQKKHQKILNTNNKTNSIMDDDSDDDFNIFQGCNSKFLEVYSEINGPRRKVYDPRTRIEGNLMDDGNIDITTHGPRIFLPQHFHLHSIHKAFPNATWILNHREPISDWVESVMEWGDHLDQQFANEYFAQNVITEIPHNKTDMINFLTTIYQDHMDLIRNFVTDHPSHTLVEITITDEDAGEKLADQFGLDSKWWHHRNKNQKGTFAYYAKQHMPKFVSVNRFEGSTLWWILLIVVTTYLVYTVGLFQPW